MLRISLFLAVLMLTACERPLESKASTPTAVAVEPDLPSDDWLLEDAWVLRERLAAGDLSAEALVQASLDRIARLDDAGPELNAVLALNEQALAEARRLDQAFVKGGTQGPLHGLPVLLKANIDTGDDMPTHAGSLALAQQRAADDAFHVERLRAAGAIILGKTNLSEWANFRDYGSSSGWSSVGGQTRNPHVLDRNPCGSSSGSGVAVAAGLAPLAVGTETNGSIVCPAGMNGIVGIKPTLGVVSRDGIIPIAHSQDTAGPMARSVRDAALMLEAMIALDPADPGAQAWPGGSPSLQPDPLGLSLAGKRIGIYRSYTGAGQFPRVEAIYEQAAETLAALGAELVDPVSWSAPEGLGQQQLEVLLTEFKADLNAYLAAADVPAEVATLAQLVAWNEAHAAAVMPIFGQDIFIDAQARDGLHSAAYLEAREGSNVAVRQAMDALLDEYELDALFIPVNGPAWKTDWVQGDRYSFGGTSTLSAVSGLPSIVLPAGAVMSLPVNVGFLGRAFSEAELIQMAYALEQALEARITPTFIPTLEK